MLTKAKGAQLNIRTTEVEKATLARAARIINVSTSQFVLRQSLEAANAIIEQEASIRVAADEHAWLLKRLQEPPQELPRLRELFSHSSVFES